MSETRLILTASTSMILLCSLVAAALISLKAAPGIVILASSLAGIAAYAGLCFYGSRFVKQERHPEKEPAIEHNEVQADDP